MYTIELTDIKGNTLMTPRAGTMKLALKVQSYWINKYFKGKLVSYALIALETTENK